MLSNYCSEIADEWNIKVGGVKKNFGDNSKSGHVLHYRNLQPYLSLFIIILIIFICIHLRFIEF